jgi:hypothetical protein
MIKIIKLLIATVGLFTVLSAITYFLLDKFMPAWLPQNFWLIPTYYIIASVLMSWFAHKASQNKAYLSLQVLLGVRLIIVVLGLMFLFVGLFFDREHAISLTIIYVLYYVIFSVVETNVMLKLSKVK